MIQSELIKNAAYNAGFDLCGIAPCRHFAENEHYFREWLAAGYGADLHYLERHLDKRFDISRLVEGAQSVIVCAVNYKSLRSEGYPATCHTKIASYACNGDYHPIIKGMLNTLYTSLKERCPSLQARAFTDSAPLLEKRLAVEAGLGWIGRQSLLVTPQFGTFVLLGELVISEAVDEYDTPFEGSRCGECRRCIEACPNGAILPTKNIDARRCISRLTIEKEPSVAHLIEAKPSLNDLSKLRLDGWIFGCDLCQSCCPYNRTTPLATNPHFATPLDPASLSVEEWLSMSEEEFFSRFGHTPLLRSGLSRIKQSIQSQD